MSLIQLSEDALLLAFILYCISFIVFVIAIAGKKWNNRDPIVHVRRWGRLAVTLTVIGLASQLTYFVTRWIAGGHVPTSNMFEFMTFLSMAITAAFIILFWIYRLAALGLFAMPVSIILISYAAVFPKEVQPLIPALKSYWLYIHVTTAALGEAFFAIGFAAGLMYLIRTMDYTTKSKETRNAKRGIDFTIYAIIMVIGFVLVSNGFKSTDYKAEFTQQVQQKDEATQQFVNVTKKTIYTLPPIIQPSKSEVVQMDSFMGMDQPLLSAPAWMKGIDSGKKLNTVVWSLLSGLILYWLLRLIVRRPLGAVIQKTMGGIDPDDLDEISYRAIAIGYPIFALGALIFAMIWAHEAWGRFWGWDPKETWALITFLFYTVYLHLRLSRGWQGKKSSWLSVLGFVVVMFTLIGVNLIIAGLHSYAGV
jgi:ABC-type transport system involved in cytochrome c biogenesis permease subunit